jgi:antitoxin component YwqK of YwqJK toxin-antitoxin module
MNKIYLLIFSVLVSYFGFSQPVNQVDSKGFKTGKWQKNYDNGKLRYEGEFSNGYEVGTFTYYFPTGKIQSKLDFSDKGKMAHATIYYKSGVVEATGFYFEKQKHGNWKYYSETTEELVKEENYIKGKKNGLVLTYFPQHGIVAVEYNYINDKKEGLWKEFFEDGKPKLLANYKDDLLQGEYTSWYANGKVNRKGQYEKGKSVGLWTTYTEEGQFKKMERYKMGLLEFERIFENGLVVYEKDYTTNKVLIDKRKKAEDDSEE